MNNEIRGVINGLLALYYRDLCLHENTHRGGFLWEICDDCGAKWADDRGGRKPYVEPEAVTQAERLLAESSTKDEQLITLGHAVLDLLVGDSDAETREAAFQRALRVARKDQ